MMHTKKYKLHLVVVNVIKRDNGGIEPENIGKLSIRWEDNIGMDLKGIWCNAVDYSSGSG
jgi:hypothetical protein